MTSVTFDTLAYAKKLIAAGFTREQAEIQAEAVVEVLEAKVDEKFENAKKELATNTDIMFLTGEIKKLELEIAELVVRFTKTIYTVGLVQYLAIMASVIAVVKLLIR